MKHISFRKLKTLDLTVFKDDIARSDLFNDADPEKLVELYNNTLRLRLDRHVPITLKKVLFQPNVPWIKSDIIEAKRQSRKAETEKMENYEMSNFPSQNNRNYNISVQMISQTNLKTKTPFTVSLFWLSKQLQREVIFRRFKTFMLFCFYRRLIFNLYNTDLESHPNSRQPSANQNEPIICVFIVLCKNQECFAFVWKNRLFRW